MVNVQQTLTESVPFRTHLIMHIVPKYYTWRLCIMQYAL